jgi:threonine/homoserine/homoserine lactone efflux protein
MALEVWLAFALASLILLAIPGPTVMLVVSYALGRGRASAWATFLPLAAFVVLLWASLAGEMHVRFRRPATMRLVNRLGGTCLIAAGVLAATMRRA